MYLKIENDTVSNYSMVQLLKDNPSTSFPREPSDSLLSEYNVFKYTKTNTVVPDGYVLGKGAFKKVDGSWVFDQPLLVDENYSEQEELTASDKIKFQRSALLGATDWWALSDHTMTAKQNEYRQALRDITDQIGFPDDIIWPRKP